MPIDNYTKDFFKSVKTHLGTIVGRLDTLVGMADKPRKDDAHTPSEPGTSNEESITAVRTVCPPTGIYPSPESQNKSTAAWEHSVQKWKPVAELVGLAFAITYAIITYCQWHDANKNFRIDERAWIRVDLQSDETGRVKMLIPAENKAFAINYSLSNTGKTPAADVIVKSSIVVLSPNQSVPVEQLDDLKSEFGDTTQYGAIFPNQKLPPDFIMRAVSGVPKLASREEIEGLNNGTLYIAIYGIVRYNDVFGKRHWTKFCEWHGSGFSYEARSCSAVNGIVDHNDL